MEVLGFISVYLLRCMYSALKWSLNFILVWRSLRRKIFGNLERKNTLVFHVGPEN